MIGRNVDSEIGSASMSNDFINLDNDEHTMDELPVLNSQSSATASTQERKKYSWVWNHFEADRVNQIATCISCRHNLSWKTGGGKGGTGHLGRHLEKQHGITKDGVRGSGGIQGTINTQTGLTFLFNDLVYKMESMKFVIGSALPFGFCDGWRFTSWIQKAVNPRAKRIPRTSLRTYAFKYFKNEKIVLCNTLSTLPWNICLTSDIGDFSDFDIMCVTCHWIDKDWILQRRIIYFRSIAKHNNIQITDGILKCAEEYKCLNKISAISFDNASSNGVAIEKIKMSAKPDFPEIFHVRCLCHILQLVAQDGIRVVWEEFISPIRKAVLFIVNGGAKKHEYKKIVEQSGKKFKKLILDVDTRWNSTYDLLVRAYMYKEEITTFYNLHAPVDNFYGALSYTNWKYCLELLRFLEPFKDYTKVFSTQYSPNIHQALECVVNLSMHMNKFKDEHVVTDMVPNMLEKFLKYFHPIPLSYAIGAILDPNIRLKMFHLFVDHYYDNLQIENPDLKNYDRKKYQEYVQTYMYNMYNKYQKRHAIGKITNTQNASAPRSSVKIRSKHNHLRMALQQEFASSSTPSQDLNELTQYLTTNFELDQYDDDSNPFDILKWWSSKESTFPVLSKMAKEILAIPMSTIASESAFSMAKLQYTHKRSRLTSSAVEVCVAIKDWTAAEQRMQDQEALVEVQEDKDAFEFLSDIEEDIEEEERTNEDVEDLDEESEDELLFDDL